MFTVVHLATFTTIPQRTADVVKWKRRSSNSSKKIRRKKEAVEVIMGFRDFLDFLPFQFSSFSQSLSQHGCCCCITTAQCIVVASAAAVVALHLQHAHHFVFPYFPCLLLFALWADADGWYTPTYIITQPAWQRKVVKIVRLRRKRDSTTQKKSVLFF